MIRPVCMAQSRKALARVATKIAVLANNSTPSSVRCGYSRSLSSRTFGSMVVLYHRYAHSPKPGLKGADTSCQPFRQNPPAAQFLGRNPLSSGRFVLATGHPRPGKVKVRLPCSERHGATFNSSCSQTAREKHERGRKKATSIRTLCAFGVLCGSAKPDRPDVT